MFRIILGAEQMFYRGHLIKDTSDIINNVIID